MEKWKYLCKTNFGGGRYFNVSNIYICHASKLNNETVLVLVKIIGLKLNHYVSAAVT